MAKCTNKGQAEWECAVTMCCCSTGASERRRRVTASFAVVTRHAADKSLPVLFPSLRLSWGFLSSTSPPLFPGSPCIGSEAVQSREMDEKTKIMYVLQEKRLAYARRGNSNESKRKESLCKFKKISHIHKCTKNKETSLRTRT